MSILDEIVHYKRSVELPQRMTQVPLAEIRKAAEAQPARRLDFAGALKTRPGVALIAEIKKASPSRGILRADLDVPRLAQTYADHGAAAISVLTDEKYFLGSRQDLMTVRRALKDTPLLYKNFIVTTYQLYEACLSGADCALLIAAVLDDHELADLYTLCGELGLQALIETHDAGELVRALKLNPALVGVNNRNLHDFSTHINTCLSLRGIVPPEVCFVAESGIHTRRDIEQLYEAGVDAALIGEALVTAADPGTKIKELFDGR